MAQRISRLSVFGSWATIASALAAIVLVVAPPIHPLTLALAGLLPLLTIALGGAVVVGASTRARTLVACAAATLMASTIVIWPFDAAHDCRRIVDGENPSITVYSANVLKTEDGGIPSRYRDDILATNPDVVLLQEASPGFLQALDDGSLSQFTYRSVSGGTALWSRLPTTGGALAIPKSAWFESATVDVGGADVVVVSIHAAAPFTLSNQSAWEEQFATLTDTVPAGVPVIIGGDFNATSAHRPFRDLAATGLSDVHDEAGCGMDLTWPVDTFSPLPVPPLLRLDHVLVSHDFDVVGLQVGPRINQPLGSDHHPIVTQLNLTG